jgi:hypothetical protein
MRRFLRSFMSRGRASTVGDTPDVATSTTPIQAGDLVGRWRLVGAGGEPPGAVQIKSLELEILSDGTWRFESAMEGQFAGMSLNGGGTWSLANGVITHRSGGSLETSTARLNGRVLVLDPDLAVRRGGTVEVAGEYERCTGGPAAA